MADTKVFSFPENGNGGGGNDLATLLALSGNKLRSDFQQSRIKDERDGNL